MLYIIFKRLKQSLGGAFTDSRSWKRVIDFTKIKKGGIEIKELIKILTLEHRGSKTYKK